ncbi:fasciclin domain-containing protein [Dactylosporangium sp. NBC_01737]|uniref:fasciclin domain-containing protein n=1 Tax=Dactylosporangium sp. NBC_01737 TaxID=2975959 RepID=UPI002E163186
MAPIRPSEGSEDMVYIRTSFTVNGASMVICGNVQTANAIVYIVDTVLMPKA